jgi:muconate cycloisomerase
MRIRHLTAYIVRLPLKRAFTHASATRRDTENILIRCELANGTLGWGEGVPREYVTGETPAGCLEQLSATPLAEQLSEDCGSWPDAIRLCERFAPPVDRDDPRGCYGNALRCAIELSILDAYGRLFGEPLSAVAKHIESAKPVLKAHPTVQYSAVIDSGNHKLWRKALIRRLYGFCHCKVKVGHAGDDDVDRLGTIRCWAGPRMDIRADANEAWSPAELPKKLDQLRPFRLSAIEQPVPHCDVDSLADLRAALGVPVILDESLTSIVDAKRAVAQRTCDIFNIRLSKCGGYLASLRLAAMAHSAGLGFQLGCHPGESGILSAAGRHWACNVGGIRFLEGSYDRYLFRNLLTNEDITFGYGGRASALNGPGLGVAINDATLREATVSEHVIDLA